MNNDNAQGRRDLESLRDVVRSLLDQFDAVQIVAVRHDGEDEGTAHATYGFGNWYARIAATERVLVRMKAGFHDDQTIASDEPGE